MGVWARSPALEWGALLNSGLGDWLSPGCHRVQPGGWGAASGPGGHVWEMGCRRGQADPCQGGQSSTGPIPAPLLPGARRPRALRNLAGSRSWQVSQAVANWICEFDIAVYRKLLVPRTGWKLDFGLLAGRCALIRSSCLACVRGARAAAAGRGSLETVCPLDARIRPDQCQGLSRPAPLISRQMLFAYMCPWASGRPEPGGHGECFPMRSLGCDEGLQAPRGRALRTEPPDGPLTGMGDPRPTTKLQKWYDRPRMKQNCHLPFFRYVTSVNATAD